jgi:hypothetical protein
MQLVPFYAHRFELPCSPKKLVTARSLLGEMLTIRVTSSPMIAKLQRAETTAAHEWLVSETSSREAAMISERANCRVLQLPRPKRDPTNRRLRNRILVVNAIAWIAIIAMIHLIFF